MMSRFKGASPPDYICVAVLNYHDQSGWWCLGSREPPPRLYLRCCIELPWPEWLMMSRFKGASPRLYLRCCIELPWPEWLMRSRFKGASPPPDYICVAVLNYHDQKTRWTFALDMQKHWTVVSTVDWTCHHGMQSRNSKTAPPIHIAYKWW